MKISLNGSGRNQNTVLGTILSAQIFCSLRESLTVVKGRWFDTSSLLSTKIVAKFFCSHRDGELERDHCNMLRCILYDILKTDKSFFIHFNKHTRIFEALNLIYLFLQPSIVKPCRRFSTLIESIR